MDPKNTLRAITLELRRELEGKYDGQGNWQQGDLERRLAAIGVRRDRPPVPVDELSHLSSDDCEARRVADAFLRSRAEVGQSREVAVSEFVRDTAYTWANRLVALRCMEARGLIDEVILQKEAYGGRSLQHNRFAKKQPERCAGEDEGLFATLFDEFARRAEELPLLFDPHAPEVMLRPSVAALKRCIALLSGTSAVKGQEPATDDIFTAPDALGWAYQYWNTEEKDRVFEKVRTTKGSKIEGAEIIPATCIYTEPYMVKFLVQNSLGAMWIDMHPSSRLCKQWEYYVRDADRECVSKKLVSEITFLDPACGSGHFLIEAFELFYAMYVEEGALSEPAEICASILERNLYGIDIDERAVQIAALALVMKAKERAPDFAPRRVNLVATNIRLPAGSEHLEDFLRKHPDDVPLKPALLTIFEGLAHADELGSLLQIEEPVDRELRHLREGQFARERKAGATSLFAPRNEAEWFAWKEGVIGRLREHFNAEARDSDLTAAFFGEAASKGLSLVDLLARRYDIVTANPPYMGSHKMGQRLLGYLKGHYQGCSRDLYAAFLRRSCALLIANGVAALVTMHGYLFLSSLESVRRFLIGEMSVEVVAHLGPHAFDELGDHAPAAMICVSNRVPEGKHEVVFFDLTRERDKQPVLLSGPPAIRRAQQSFSRLPGARILYSLPHSVIRLFEEMRPLENDTDGTVVRRGLDTGAVPLFVRLHWEVSTSDPEWVPYCKGGDTRKWYGNSHFVVRWSSHGPNRVEFRTNSIIPNRHLYFRDGATFSRSSGTGLNARHLPCDTLIGCEGPGVLNWPGSVWELVGFLGSRAVEYVASVINPSMHYQTGDVAVVPMPSAVKGNAQLSTLAHFCHMMAHVRAEQDPTDRAYNATKSHRPIGSPRTLGDAWRTVQNLQECTACLQHTAEAMLDRVVFSLYGITSTEDASVLLAGIGTPPGWYALVRGFDTIPADPRDQDAAPDFASELGGVVSRQLSADQLASLKRQLRALYEAGTSSSDSEEEPSSTSATDSDEEDSVAGRTIPIPPETFLEDLSQKLQIHPISVYWLLRELRDKEGVVSKPELMRFVEDYLSVVVLRVLGHSWPRELEAQESAACTDEDGIIPLTEGTSEAPLIARVRACLASDFGGEHAGAVEREFQEITGKPLGVWLASDFFKRHISQFRKRPVVWQLASSGMSNAKRRGRGAAQRAPAFSCLIYYHRLDADLLPKLRTHYIGQLRSSLQTELGGLEKMPERSAAQDARRLELDGKLEELKTLDALIEQVISSGFTSVALNSLASNEPLDKWTSRDGRESAWTSREAFLAQERKYIPDLNDGVRINISPLQRAGVLAADVLAAKDIEKAIADRAQWRADERRWCREGKLQRPGWWTEDVADVEAHAAVSKKTIALAKVGP